MRHDHPRTLLQHFLYAFGRMMPGARLMNRTSGSVGVYIGDLTFEERQRLRSLTDKRSANVFRELERIRRERGEDAQRSP